MGGRDHGRGSGWCSVCRYQGARKNIGLDCLICYICQFGLTFKDRIVFILRTIRLLYFSPKRHAKTAHLKTSLCGIKKRGNNTAWGEGKSKSRVYQGSAYAPRGCVCRAS